MAVLSPTRVRDRRRGRFWDGDRELDVVVYELQDDQKEGFLQGTLKQPGEPFPFARFGDGFFMLPRDSELTAPFAKMSPVTAEEILIPAVAVRAPKGPDAAVLETAVKAFLKALKAGDKTTLLQYSRPEHKDKNAETLDGVLGRMRGTVASIPEEPRLAVDERHLVLGEVVFRLADSKLWVTVTKVGGKPYVDDWGPPDARPSEEPPRRSRGE